LQNQVAKQKSSSAVAERESVDLRQPEARALDKDAKNESVQAKLNAPALADSTGNLTRAVAPAPAPAAPPAPTTASAPPAAAASAVTAQAAPRAAPAEAGARMDAATAPSRMAFAAGLEVIVVSSNPATRFRLMPGGGVQRSADAGSTWRTEVTGAT